MISNLRSGAGHLAEETRAGAALRLLGRRSVLHRVLLWVRKGRGRAALGGLRRRSSRRGGDRARRSTRLARHFQYGLEVFWM